MILRGDLVDVLPTLPAASFDACLCDPPYALNDKRPANSASPRKSSRERTRGGFMGMGWDAGIPGPEIWTAVLRVLKPGAFLLAFGGTRTHHRLMCAIEDAGFEIRDCMMWLYGQGFPKSLDILKAIDKRAGAERQAAGTSSGPNASRYTGDRYTEKRQTRFGVVQDQPTATLPATDAAKLFDGYGTALKPAWEPIIVAMKPCEGTFAENAVKHGIAGLDIDGSRIGSEQITTSNTTFMRFQGQNTRPWQDGHENYDTQHSGRWPANLVLDEDAAAALDRQSGHLVSGNNPAKRSADKHRTVYAGWKGEQCLVHRGTDSGGASRFFYCAKASRSERGKGNTHPTVKPLKLTEYLARLILPPRANAKLLVPFAGSGSEIIGARRAGWKHITGIEREAAYVAIAEKRLLTMAA